uniref:Vitellogenin 2 n=1 Tax=Varroa destructor TaxID=109461 RepID=I7AQA8_VARDE|nr:vitellogenin 2 [Varroa destructor]
MKVLFACFGLVTVAAAVPGPNEDTIPELFHDQSEYVYNYRSLVATGMPHQSSRYAGVEKYGTLTVQMTKQQGSSKVLGLHLGHVQTGSFDKEVEDIENRRVEGVSRTIDEMISRYGPVFVSYQENEVQKLQAPQGMPEEIVNVYRAIAAALTVGKPETQGCDSHPFMFQGADHDQWRHERPIVYRRYEQGIAGTFETIYEILSSPKQNQQLNVTKTRNYMKQIGRDGRYFQNGHDWRGCQNVCPTHRPERVDANMQPDTSGWEMPADEGCPAMFHPKLELVEAYTTYNYNLTLEQGGKLGLIHEVHALDKKVLPLRHQQIMTISVMKLSLVEQRPISQIWQKDGATKQYEDFIYRFPEGHRYDLAYLALFKKQHNGDMLKEQIISMIKALSEIIVFDNIKLKGQTGDKIVQLSQALGNLSKEDLQALWGIVGEPVQASTRTELEQVQRKVLIDTIGLSGSNDAAEFLVELIKQQQLSILETVHVLEGLQKNIVNPTTQTMDRILEICTGQMFQEQPIVFSTACIALSEIVRSNCGQHQTRQWQNQQQWPQWLYEQQTIGNGKQIQFCGEQEYKRFVYAVRDQLTSARSFTQQGVYIQTLGRLSHPEAITALVPYVYAEPEVITQIEKMNPNDKEEDNSEYVQFLRQIAIFALHNSAKEHGAAVYPIVQGIYFNQEEDYDIRIAALSVLLTTQPTEATFGRIVIELGRERNQEVASFAYSALRSMANSTLPCMKQSARRIQNVLGALPQNSYDLYRSKWYTASQYFPLHNMGLKGHWEIIQSNVSAIPRAVYTGFTANKGPFISNIGEFGMLAKGLENLDKGIPQNGGMSKIVENVLQRMRRGARTGLIKQMLEDIEQAMQFNTEKKNEHPRAVVFGNFLGNELYMPLDNDYMGEIVKKVGEQIIQLQGTDKTFRYVHVLMPHTYIQVAPGVNGLPVMLANHNPIVISLSLKNLQTRFGAEKGQFKLDPYMIAASGLIRPTVYYTSIHTAKVINPVENTRFAHGVRAIEQTYVTFPIDASLQYTQQTRTVGFTFRPRFEQIFYHMTRAMTFKTEAFLIRSVDKPFIEQYTTFKTQPKPFIYERVLGEKLGMAFRVQGLSMSEDYAVDPIRARIAGSEPSTAAALIKEVVNEWFLSRTWSARIEPTEQKPVEEIKLVLHMSDLLEDRISQGKNQQQKQERLSHEQLVEEQAHPENMRMIAYSQEYEKVTGRKPEIENIEQAVERTTKQTEKYWSLVEPELGRKLNKDNIQVCSVEYILTTNSQKEQQFAVTGHMIVAATLSKQAQLVEVKMNVENSPIYFEGQAVAAFTKAPQPFEIEVNEKEPLGVFGFIAQLKTAQTGKQQYAGKFLMSMSEEQKELMKRPIQEMPWFRSKCEKDKKEHQSEMSTACEATRYHMSALNKLTFEIELPQQIPDGFASITHKAREALKTHFYMNLHANYFDKNIQRGRIDGELVYSDSYPEMCMVNFSIHTPDQEDLFFERVAVPKALRPNTMWSIKEQAKAILRNGRPEPICIYNGLNLRTFDNVTISVKTMKQGEKYVILRDMDDEQSKFTILAKRIQNYEQYPETELHVFLRESTFIQLTPPKQQGQYNVWVNNTMVDVTSTKAIVSQYAGRNKHMVTLHVEEHMEGQDTLVMMVHDQSMRIVYDGKNFQIELAKWQQKGQLTGLCGSANNEYDKELVGPRGCLYKLDKDFVGAFSINQDQAERMQGEWTCPEGVQSRDATRVQITKQQQQFSTEQPIIRQDRDRIIEETRMITLGGKICFSVEPVPTCEHGYQQLQGETRSVGFSCHAPNHPRTIQIQRQVQTQLVATDLLRSSSRQGSMVYYDIRVATRCTH